MKTWRTHRTVIPDFSLQNIPDFPATRFFDGLSFIGNEVLGCFPLETEEGIVLLDCMLPDKDSERCIEKGFADLGLDIRELRAIVITHGHGDHYGNADRFKAKYGTKIYMGETDYQTAHHPPAGFPWRPLDCACDHFLQDGELLRFGNVWIKCVLTPGHTPGCFSLILPVTDEGVPHTAALWGGSGILPSSDVTAYQQSLVKFTEECRANHVDCEIATHPCLDNGLERLNVVRRIVDGIPNPFVLGEDGYRYYEQQFYALAKRHASKSVEHGQSIKGETKR